MYTFKHNKFKYPRLPDGDIECATLFAVSGEHCGKHYLSPIEFFKNGGKEGLSKEELQDFNAAGNQRKKQNTCRLL